MAEYVNAEALVQYVSLFSLLKDSDNPFITSQKAWAIRKMHELPVIWAKDLQSNTIYIAHRSVTTHPCHLGDGGNYFSNGAILFTGEKKVEKTYGKETKTFLAAHVSGSTFRVTSNSGFANTPATWITAAKNLSPGFIDVSDDSYLRVVQLVDAIEVVKKELDTLGINYN